MRSLSYLIAFLICVSTAQADPRPLGPGESLRGRFVQERFLTGFEHPARSEGSFLLAPGQGLIWKVETPFAIITAITPTGLVQSVNGRETLRLDSARMPFLSHLYEMMTGTLTGDWSAVDANFRVSREGDVVILTPNHEGTPLPTIHAHVRENVDAVDMERPGGDRDHLRFDHQQVGSAPLSLAEIEIFRSANR